MSEGAGTAFATAFAAKDWAGMRELLDPDVDFRALTPNKFWEVHDSEAAIAEILQDWIEDEDSAELVSSSEGVAGDRNHVAYRLRFDGPEGRELVEQQAYYEVDDGRISWIRILCVGFWPDPGE